MRILTDKGWIQMKKQRPKIFMPIALEISLMNYLERKKEELANMEKHILKILKKSRARD